LAGCALAYVLKQAGAEPVIYEASSDLAAGASGNEVGLYNPRFSAQLDGPAQFYSAAYFEALKVFEHLGDEIDWNPCGALHLIVNDMKARRFPKTVASWGWPEGDMRLVDAVEASEIAGVPVEHACLYLPRSGTVSPRKLCHAYAQGAQVHLNSPVDHSVDLAGDVTVLACGLGCLSFPDAAYLPLTAVRGQLSFVEETDVSSVLRAALCYDGYIAPALGGVHCVGATFQRWLDHSDVLLEDDGVNLSAVYDGVGLTFDSCIPRLSRASVRTVSKDYFPVVGCLGKELYISTAHGSYGILSSLLSAQILSNKLLGGDDRFPNKVLRLLDPFRFL